MNFKFDLSIKNGKRLILKKRKKERNWGSFTFRKGEEVYT